MQFFGITDVGMKRETNQDSFYVGYPSEIYSQNDILLAVVCDGMGGAAGGNIASSLAVETFIGELTEQLRLHFENTDGNNKLSGDNNMKVSTSDISDIGTVIGNALSTAVYEANYVLHKKALSDASLSGMGTTLVACIIYKNILYAINVGDSRLYLFADGNIIQLTRDHSYVQALLDSGHITKEEAKTHPNKNIIMRALGIDSDVDGDSFKLMGAGNYSAILLCSDGLSNFIDENELTKIILANNSIEQICKTLTIKANENGGGDNITALVIKP